MGYTLSDFASSLNITTFHMALSSWMLVFIQGHKMDYDGTYELESTKKF